VEDKEGFHRAARVCPLCSQVMKLTNSAMAFCAPRQLSLSLPTIIPHLTGVINDSHAQVKSAANASLKRFGEVLSNPEIKALQSVLMKALADPTANINKALTSLLKTSFEHYLDAPSLALVMPIIDRGLKQRSSEIKRKSVQIVGNMASLTEARDLTPYLDQLMPLLHEVLVDPVPEARATAAKSLGTLVERLGEPSFPELVNQLMSVLRSDTGGIDRQGSAQGLSEVLSALGMERMEGLLPEVITNTSSPRAYVREGFISLLVYLPATFGHRFAPHLGRVIPPILNGLADSSEYVREASLNAGKMIISNYSTKAIDLLLPELEKGMLDVQWRIRSASIELTGLLLYRVTGISGKVDLEEGAEAPQAADNARKALLDALGQERRDRILATLYIVRQDTVNVVRSSSIHIWKALVQSKSPLLACHGANDRYTKDDEGDLTGIDANDYVSTWKSRGRTARNCFAYPRRTM
jgi:HEAT repeat protein